MAKLIKPLFRLGQIVSTPGALDALCVSGIRPDVLLNRHITGDWGEVTEDDKRENEISVTEGFRIHSAYTLLSTDTRIWIITEADRSVTTLLLPDEY